MESNSNCPPSLKRFHQWPLADRIERQAAYEAEVLAECRRVAILFDLPPAEVEVEALWLARNPQPLEVTVDQIENEREVMYAIARKRGVPLEEVKADIDAVIDGLLAQRASQVATVG